MGKYKFINNSGLIFKDISSEKFREYTYPNGCKLIIQEPLLINVSKSGGHRIFDDNGYCWYVQPAEGWSIKWKPFDGEPHFVK